MNKQKKPNGINSASMEALCPGEIRVILAALKVSQKLSSFRNPVCAMELKDAVDALGPNYFVVDT